MQNSVLRSRMTLVYWSQPSSVVLCIQICDFSVRITSLYGSQPSFVAFECKTANLGPELQVFMGPSLHLCFLHSKQRLKHKNCKSLWVPALICGFSCKTATFGSELQVSMGPRLRLFICECKTACLDPE